MDIQFHDLALIISSIIGGGTLSAVVTMLLKRRVTLAEAKEIEVKGAVQLIGASDKVVEMLREELERLGKRVTGLEEEKEKLIERVTKLEAENRQLEIENEELKRTCTKLERQIRKLGQDPVR